MDDDDLVTFNFVTPATVRSADDYVREQAARDSAEVIARCASANYPKAEWATVPSFDGWTGD